MDKSSFLQRNYYQPSSRRRVEGGSYSASSKRIAFRNQRNSNVSSNPGKSFTRDFSGQKIMFNTSTMYQDGKNMVDETGKQMFVPSINEKSKMMSPRSRDQTFEMLHV